MRGGESVNRESIFGGPGAATDQRGTRAWPVDRVGAVGALGDWATDLATMSFGGGELCRSPVKSREGMDPFDQVGS